jgi:hypothetical protein
VAGFRRSVTRAVARLAPRRAEEAHAAAVAGRGVRARPLPDAMGQLTATVTAEDLAAVMEVLNAEATRLTTSGDGRTVGQLRADTPRRPDPGPHPRHPRNRRNWRNLRNWRDGWGAGAGHRRVVDADRVGRPARRAGRLRPHPGLDGPPHRRRRRQRVAPPGHRRPGPPARLRPRHLPAPGRARGLRARLRPTLRVPHLQPPPGTATSTTYRPGTTTATPTSTTSPPNAPDTTRSNTKPTGQCNDYPTAPSNGHRPPATPTTDPSTHSPPTTPSR